MQLLYILPCFPPYDPGSLPARLAGLTMAVLLLAVAEVVLWPDPAPVPYRKRLGDAVGALAGCLHALADSWDGDPTGRDRLAALLPEATDAADALRPSRLPPIQRPASAGRRDRALSSAAGTARLMLGRAVDLYFTEERDAVTLPAATRCCARPPAASRRPRPGCAAPGRCPTPAASRAALTEFRVARMNTDPNGLPPDRLRLGSMALSAGGVDQVADLRDPGRGRAAPEPPRPDAADGAAGAVLVRVPEGPRPVVAPPAGEPHAALGRTSKAPCAWPSPWRWPGCWPACSTCRTASGCC